MANIYLYLDTRTVLKDGTSSLKLGLNHNRKTAFHPLGIYLKPDEWDANRQQVVSRPDKKFQNVILKKMMAEGTLTLQRMEQHYDLDGMTVRQMMDMVVRGADVADEDMAAEEYVLHVYKEYMTLCRKTNTVATYRSSLRSIMEFEPRIDTLTFKDINVAWLRRYQNWLTGEKGMAVNGANVYLRNLRTIYNYARKNQYTYARYPFRDIDMSTTEPDKNEIKWEDFLEWATYPVKDRRAFYRDIFMLSYYLCGIRPVDILHVKKSQVVDGRLVYWPEKLNGRTKLSIKIEPEAWEIIKKYEGKEYLLNILESRTDYKSFMQHWNKALKAIGEDEITYHNGRKGRVYYTKKHHGVIPRITCYYSRSCWASYAYNELGVPIDIISQAFGHKNGLKVTNFYVKRGLECVDKANREMIDMLSKAMLEYREKHKIA